MNAETLKEIWVCKVYHPWALSQDYSTCTYLQLPITILDKWGNRPSAFQYSIVYYHTIIMCVYFIWLYKSDINLPYALQTLPFLAAPIPQRTPSQPCKNTWWAELCPIGEQTPTISTVHSKLLSASVHSKPPYVSGFEKRAHFAQNAKFDSFQPIITW